MIPKRTEIIVREGLYYILPLAGMTILAAIVGMTGTSCLFFLLTAFCSWFFRNPERTISDDEAKTAAVISPADGKVIRIEEIDEPKFLKTRCLKISIFMNIFDVHVNRIPFSGTIEAIEYRKGSFLSADLDKASDQNEKNMLLLKTEDDRKLLFIQVAGLIARRIVCWVQPGSNVSRGERFGLICFGSRLELFLPLNTKINVAIGDRVKSGSTIMGWLV